MKRRAFLKITAGALPTLALGRIMLMPELKKPCKTVMIRGLAPGTCIAFFNAINNDMLYLGEVDHCVLEVALPDVDELPIRIVARKPGYEPMSLETSELPDDIQIYLNQNIDNAFR